MVGFFNASSCPSDWVVANGSGGTRGRFVRGVEGNSGSIGSVQEDAIRNITGYSYTARRPSADYSDSLPADAYQLDGAYSAGHNLRNPLPVWQRYSFNASNVVPTANENRPVNVALLACIKS